MAAVQQISAEDVSRVASSISKFSVALYQAASKQAGPSENILISPFSVAAVLSMIHAGAKGNTASEIKSALHVTNLTEEEINRAIGSLLKGTKGGDDLTLQAANQVYMADRYELTTNFQTTLNDHFGITAERVDFGDGETRTKINQWVEDLTKQKIKELLPQGSLNALTKLALVNAVYFKGSWMRKFDAALTKKENFYLGSTDKIVEVDMMHIEADFRSGNIDSLDARVLELPYIGRKISMIIILPNQIDGLETMESKLPENLMEEIENALSSAKIQVAIPKFRLDASVDMKKTLAAVGLSDMFSEKEADFSGMSGKKDLYVSDIFHKTFIDVNEEGSEAAAATGAIMMTRMMIFPPDPHAPFIADHPFYFTIRNNVDNVFLFTGRIARL